MEAGEIALYMFLICTFATLLLHPTSPLRHLIHSVIFRRALMGLLIGSAVVAIIMSPWGKQSGGRRAGVARAAIQKCGFFGTITGVSCVSIPTYVSLWQSSGTSLAFHLRSQRKENQTNKRTRGKLQRFLIVERSCYSKLDPTAPKRGGSVMAFQLLFKTVSIDILTYPDRVWRMKYGEIRNYLEESRTCEAHYAAAKSRKRQQPRVVRPGGIRRRREPWLLDNHFRFRGSRRRPCRLEQTVGSSEKPVRDVLAA
jgi:hypothetical protein